MPTAEFHTLSHLAHARVYEDERHQRLASTWTRDDNVDAWRHARMYACLDPLLGTFPGSSWVTLGDGRYGSDAHYLEQHGAEAVATDIAETLLSRAKAQGFIREYRTENAERLTFADGTFDFALCKEAYHHFPRPMLAVYEMLRVARRGVVLIEPDQSPTLVNGRRLLKMIAKEGLIRAGLGRFFADRSTDIIDCGNNWYEDAGNFGYCISRREIERVALGLNLPHVAFRGVNDAYIDGVEHEPADEGSALFRRIRAEIEALDRRCRRGLSRAHPKLLVAIVLKDAVQNDLRQALVSAGFDVHDLPRNPYLG